MATFELIIDKSTNQIKHCFEISAIESYNIDNENEFIFYISDPQMFERIKGALEDTSVIYLPKDQTNVLVYEDLIIENNPDHERVRLNRKWHKQISERFVLSHNFNKDYTNSMLYEFILLNNKFCNKGYFITDDNREQTYIDIIAKLDEENITEDDKELIICLERYLEIKDRLDSNMRAYYNYLDIISIIDNPTNDIDFIQSKVDRYIGI